MRRKLAVALGKELMRRQPPAIKGQSALAAYRLLCALI
jgi:hypothetical protein